MNLVISSSEYLIQNEAIENKNVNKICFLLKADLCVPDSMQGKLNEIN
jgi:hypothetical protein